MAIRVPIEEGEVTSSPRAEELGVPRPRVVEVDDEGVPKPLEEEVAQAEWP